MFSVNINEKIAVDAGGNVVPLRSFEDDYKFGMENEDVMLPLLQAEFKDPKMLNTKELYGDQYCQWDWEGEDKTRYENKSRRNTKWKYDTTILPVHKVCKKEGNHYYIFQFTDKNCYIKYDAEVFSKFSTRMVKVVRQGRVDNKLHYEIPVKQLIDF
jgi:hypothetical protein